jgi:hypothetical protein
MLVPARLCLRRTARPHSAPNVSLTSGRPCSAPGPRSHPDAPVHFTARRSTLPARRESSQATTLDRAALPDQDRRGRAEPRCPVKVSQAIAGKPTRQRSTGCRSALPANAWSRDPLRIHRAGRERPRPALWPPQQPAREQRQTPAFQHSPAGRQETAAGGPIRGASSHRAPGRPPPLRFVPFRLSLVTPDRQGADLRHAESARSSAASRAKPETILDPKWQLRPGARQMWFRFVRDKWHEGPAKLTVLILARLWFCLASTPPATRAVIHSAAPTAPAPARRTPGAGGTKYNSVLWPVGLLTVTLTACGRLPGPCAPAVHSSAHASSQASFMPFARTPLVGKSKARQERQDPAPTRSQFRSLGSARLSTINSQPSTCLAPHPPPVLAPLPSLRGLRQNITLWGL